MSRSRGFRLAWELQRALVICGVKDGSSFLSFFVSPCGVEVRKVGAGLLGFQECDADCITLVNVQNDEYTRGKLCICGLHQLTQHPEYPNSNKDRPNSELASETREGARLEDQNRVVDTPEITPNSQILEYLGTWYLWTKRKDSK